MATAIRSDLAGVDRASYINNKAMADIASDMSSIGSGFVDSAQKAAQALFAAGVPVDGESAETMPGYDLNKPLLAPPRTPLSKSMSSGATLMLLLGQLNELLGLAGMTELNTRIAAFKEAAEARSAALAEGAEKFSDAVTVADAAVTAYAGGKEQAAAARAAMDGAQAEAAAAEAELQALEEGDPARPQAMHKFEAAQKTLTAATQKYAGAVENEKRLSDDVVQKVRIAADLEKKAMADGAASLARRGELADLGSSSARLSLLMSNLTQMMNDGAEANMKSDQEMFKNLQMERQKALEKSAADYEAEVQKAEQTSKTMGCIGKVIGGLILAVSILAIPFTGGASLALAVIGVGLAVADTVTSAVTGKSLTAMALSPIMKALQPILDAITGAIVKGLEAMGVPPEKAKMIGSIIAAVAVAVVMIAVMIAVAVVARGPAAAKLFQAFAKSGAKMLAKVSTQTAKRATLGMEVAGSSLKIAGDGVQAHGNITGALHTQKALQIQGRVLESNFSIDQLERLLKDVITTFSEVFKTTQQLTMIGSDAMQKEMATGKAILGNMQMRA
ncbi:hypothetical protein D9O50_02010 [Oxalobacteraceae bacterium CAVE-383]|nr:hypothetical protein D9O50_02010 [Oxalobacteraceae bacterium CAVE-383]